MSDGGAANKKRGAVRQLTKDDDPDAEEEEDTPSFDGTFKKASEEVLATRRIVKVRRTTTPTTGPNPFANLQFTAPQVTATPSTEDGTSKVVVSSVTSVHAVAVEANAGAGEVSADNVDNKGDKVDESEKAAEAVNGNGTAEEKAAENGGKDEETKAAAVAAEAPTSFQQVSSTTNAFGSFTAGSGFSFSTTPSFNFGTPTGFTFGSGSSTTTPGAFSVGSFTSPSSFEPGKFEASSGPSSSSPAVPPSQPAVTLQEVVTETGEENEKAVFTCDAVLYEFVEKSWKERGKGELKVNLAEDVMKARLVMRSKGNFKLLLNAGLFPDMKTNKMDNRSVTFACVNTAASGGKEAGGLSTYAVKLREAGAVTEFMELVEQHKGVKSASPAAAAAAVAVEAAAAGGSESVKGSQDQSKDSV